MRYIVGMIIISFGLSVLLTSYLYRDLKEDIELQNKKISTFKDYVLDKTGFERDMIKARFDTLQDSLEERIGNLERDMSDIEFLKKGKK